MDPARLEETLQRLPPNRAKAIVPVHLYGHPAKLPELEPIARAHGLKIIEDCAQSHGAMIGRNKTGTFGDLATFSFYPTKNLSAIGDGGMVVTNNPELAEEVRLLREYGWRERYISSTWGTNSRLDELQAGILRVKLRYLDQWSGGRRKVADKYDELLAELSEVITPARNGFGDHVFHQYTVRVPYRDSVQKQLATLGVTTMVYYPTPMHLQPIYASLGYREGDLPVTEAACQQVFSLPMFPELQPEQIEYVVESLRQMLEG